MEKAKMARKDEMSTKGKLTKCKIGALAVIRVNRSL